MALWVPISPEAQLGWGAGSAHPEPALWGHNDLHPQFLYPQPLSESQRVLGGTKSPPGWAQQLPGATQQVQQCQGCPWPVSCWAAVPAGSRAGSPVNNNN